MNPFSNRLCLFFFMLTFTLFAQPDEIKYPFINYPASKIMQASDSSRMLGFYKKLHDYLNGKEREIRVVHIGGSHVQGGSWGDELMTDFQNLKKTKGGGFFIFPFKIVKTNSPAYFSSFSNGKWKSCRTALFTNQCNNVGMAQITATTNDSSNLFGVSILPNLHHHSFTSVRVYHNFNTSFSFTVKNECGYKRQDYETKGYSLFTLEKEMDSIAFSLTRKDTNQKDFVLYGIDVRNTFEPGMYYAGLGANGASTKSILRCDLFAAQLKTLEPDLIILSLGVNDVQGKIFSGEAYMAHYDSLIARIHEAAPNCAILFNTITDNYVRKRGPNKKSVSVEACIYKLSEKNHAAVWDIFAVMGGYKSILKWQQAGLARKDRVHFTVSGYHQFADLMFKAIMQSYHYSYKD